MAGSVFRLFTQSKHKNNDSSEPGKSSLNTQIESWPFSRLSDIQDLEECITQHDLVIRQNPSTPARDEREFRIANSYRFEGSGQSPGKELSLILITLEIIARGNSIPDYVLMLCCAVLSRVDSDILYDVKKARSLVNIFLPALCPRFPALSESVRFYRSLGLYRFLTESGVQLLKKIISLNDINFGENGPGGGCDREKNDNTLLLEDRLSPYSSCLIEITIREVEPGDRSWWIIREGPIISKYTGWTQILRPTHIEEVNEKYRLQYEALNNQSFNDLRENHPLVHELLGEMVATMHKRERSCFLMADNNKTQSPSNTNLEENSSSQRFLAIQIEILSSKLMVTSANNLFTTDLSLKRFFTRDRYSNFSQPNDVMLVAEFIPERTAPFIQPMLTRDPDSLVTIRFGYPREEIENDLGQSVIQKARELGRQAPSSPREAIHNNFKDLPSRWKWIVLTTPAETDIKFSVVNPQGRVVEQHYLIWSAVWKQKLVDNNAAGIKPSPEPSPTVGEMNPGAKSLTPLTQLRKILKLALCDIKLEIGTVAQCIVHGLNKQNSSPGSILCAAALLKRGIPLCDQAVTINKDVDPLNDSPEMRFPMDSPDLTRYRVDPSIEPSEEESRGLREPALLKDMSLNIMEDALGGNYFVTNSLATLANGLHPRSTFVTKPLKLIDLINVDPSLPQTTFDGFYKSDILDHGGMIYTVALVSTFSNWHRPNLFKTFFDQSQHVVIELGTDNIFVGINPTLITRNTLPRSSLDIAVISKSNIWKNAGIPVRWSESCLRNMVQYDLNVQTDKSENTLFSKDFTTLWPSMCVHHLPTQLYGQTLEHIQPIPSRKLATPLYKWLQANALYVIHGSLVIGTSAMICTNVFGSPTLIIPLMGILKATTPTTTMRGLGSTLNSGFLDMNRTATISTDGCEEDLVSLIAANELEVGSPVHTFLKQSQRELHKLTGKSAPVECPPMMSYVAVNANPEDMISSNEELIQILRTEHNFGRPGLWPMLYPILFIEEMKQRKSGEFDVKRQALGAWAYLVLTSKFGGSRISRKASGWTTGLVPGLFDPQYMASIEDRAQSKINFMTRSVTGGISQTAHQVCDIVDWDHLIIERNRHEMLDILLAILLIEAESKTGDITLAMLSERRSVHQFSDNTLYQTMLRKRIARILTIGFETYLAPSFLKLLITYNIRVDYESAILERCREIIDGGSYLAIEPDRSLKILGWAGFLRGANYEPKSRIWINRAGLKVILRYSGDGCAQHLKVIAAAAKQVVHTIFRSQLQIDRRAYNEIQIGSQFRNLERVVDAAAIGFLDEVIYENVSSLYVELLRKLCKYRRRLEWPNTLNRAREPEAPGLVSFSSFPKESEYLEAVLSQVPFGNVGVISAVHLITTSICRLIENGDFGASSLWQSVTLICRLLLRVSPETEDDLLELAQPEPISLRLIALIMLPLRILSAYHHLNQQVGLATAADTLGRYARSFLPHYVRCEGVAFSLGFISADLANLSLLYGLPIGPASIANASDLVANRPGFESWLGLELNSHPTLISESGVLDKSYVAVILETNYLSNEVLEAWVRAAHYLIHHPPPIMSEDSQQKTTIPSPTASHLSELLKSVMAQASLFSAGNNAGSNCLGLGGPSRFLPHEPTMASTNPSLLRKNNASREAGKDVWMTMACQAIFDGGNQSLRKILKIDSAEKHSVCLCETGQLLVFGSTKNGQLGFCFESRNEVLPSGLVRADYGDKRVLDETNCLRKKERLKTLRHLLSALTADSRTHSIHSPILLSLSEEGRLNQISNICCGAMFTLCVASSSRTLVLFWSEPEDPSELEDGDFAEEAVADEHLPGSPSMAQRLTLTNSSRYNHDTDRPSTRKSASPIHALNTNFQITSISAGVSHWVAVLDDGCLFIGGENSANQVGPWRPISSKMLTSYSALLDVLRLDCYIAKSPRICQPSEIDLAAFASAAGPPNLQTLSGGHACVFREVETSKIFVIVARPVKNLESRWPSSPIPSPNSARQMLNIGCLKEFNEARFLAADCGESHTVCLIEDITTKQRFGITWGSNDLNQQFPQARFIYSTTKCQLTPGVLAVKSDFNTVLAGAASSALGNSYVGIWSGTEVGGHLGGGGGTENSEDRILNLQGGPITLSVSRFSVMAVREAERGAIELLGGKPLGSFLAPRFLEEGVCKLWRSRELKYIKSPNERIRLPRHSYTISVATDHLLCVLKGSLSSERDPRTQSYWNDLVFNVALRAGRKYRSIDDVINNWLPVDGPTRMFKGPPESLIEERHLIPEPLQLSEKRSPRGESESAKWLQKGIEGVTKFVGLVVTNIMNEATTSSAAEGLIEERRSQVPASPAAPRLRLGPTLRPSPTAPVARPAAPALRSSPTAPALRPNPNAPASRQSPNRPSMLPYWWPGRSASCSQRHSPPKMRYNPGSPNTYNRPDSDGPDGRYYHARQYSQPRCYVAEPTTAIQQQHHYSAYTMASGENLWPYQRCPPYLDHSYMTLAHQSALPPSFVAHQPDSPMSYFETPSSSPPTPVEYGLLARADLAARSRLLHRNADQQF